MWRAGLVAATSLCVLGCPLGRPSPRPPQGSNDLTPPAQTDQLLPSALTPLANQLVRHARAEGEGRGEPLAVLMRFDVGVGERSGVRVGVVLSRSELGLFELSRRDFRSAESTPPDALDEVSTWAMQVLVEAREHGVEGLRFSSDALPPEVGEVIDTLPLAEPLLPDSSPFREIAFIAGAVLFQTADGEVTLIDLKGHLRADGGVDFTAPPTAISVPVPQRNSKPADTANRM